MTMEQIKQVYAEYMKRREVPEQQDIDPEQVQDKSEKADE